MEPQVPPPFPNQLATGRYPKPYSFSPGSSTFGPSSIRLHYPPSKPRSPKWPVSITFSDKPSARMSQLNTGTAVPSITS